MSDERRKGVDMRTFAEDEARAAWSEVNRLRSRLAEVEAELRVARWDANVARGECDMAIAAATMELRQRAEQAEAALREYAEAALALREACWDTGNPTVPTRVAEAIARVTALASVPSSLDAPPEKAT